MAQSVDVPPLLHRWTPFAVIVLVVLFALMSSATPSPLYVDYQALWGTSGTMITVVFAAYCVAVLVPLIFLGRLSDAIGRRPVVMAGMVLVGLSMVGMALSTGVGGLIAARVIQGVGVGLVTGAAGAALVELHPRRDARIGALVNGTTLNSGMAVGVLLAGFIAAWSAQPLVYPYVVIAAVSFALVVAVAVLVPETAGGGTTTLRQALRPQRLSVPPAARGTFVLASMCVVVSWSVGGVYLGLGGALVKDLMGRSDYLVTAMVIATLQGASAVAQLVWNLRFGTDDHRRGVVWGSALVVSGLAAASLAVALRSAAGFVSAMAVVGLGMGLTFLMASTLAARGVPDEVRGSVLSTFFVVAYLALGLPAVLAAFLSEFLGLTGAYHLLAAVVALIAITATVIISRPGALDGGSDPASGAQA